MLLINVSSRPAARLLKFIFFPGLCVVFALAIFSHLDPLAARADSPLKPTGTAAEKVEVWVPDGAINVPFETTADFVLKSDLPPGITPLPGTVAQPFTFGLWQGGGLSLDRFDPSIVVSARYEDSDLLPVDLPKEETLHMFMYNSTTQDWHKLCSSVDIHNNVVSAALSFPTPIERNGSSLLAIAFDELRPLIQTEDDVQQLTRIRPEGTNLELQVLPQTVEVGVNFEITPLLALSSGDTVKLLGRPVDIKACQIDHTRPHQNNRQLTGFFFKPIKVGFEYDPDTLSRAGGRTNLTIVQLQDSQWVDLERAGSRVVRGNEAITTDRSSLGTFGLAVR